MTVNVPDEDLQDESMSSPSISRNFIFITIRQEILQVLIQEAEALLGPASHGAYVLTVPMRFDSLESILPCWHSGKHVNLRRV